MLLLSPSLCAETDHGASYDAAAAATAADNDDDESGGGGDDSVNHARGKKRKEGNVANHNLSAIFKIIRTLMVYDANLHKLFKSWKIYIQPQ